MNDTMADRYGFIHDKLDIKILIFMRQKFLFYEKN